MESALDENVPEQKERLRRLFRVKATETEMMAQRNYRLDMVSMLRNDHQFNPQPINLANLRNPEIQINQLLDFRRQTGMFQTRQEFSSLYYKNDNIEDRVLVLYLGNEHGKQVAKKDFAIVLAFIQTQMYRHIILITESGLNPESNNFVNNRTIGYKIEVFTDLQLAFNITKHAFAPITVQHIPFKQVSQWAQYENIQAEKLPMIMNNDSLGKWFGADPLDGFQMEIMGASSDSLGYYRITRQAPMVKK
jgi:hypothetical protein